MKKRIVLSKIDKKHEKRIALSEIDKKHEKEQYIIKNRQET